MVFQVSGLIGGAAGNIADSSLASKFADNVFAASLLVSLLCVIIVMALFYEIPVAESDWPRRIKAGVYSFMATCAVVYAHQYVLNRKSKLGTTAHEVRMVHSSIQNSTGTTYPVNVGAPAAVGGEDFGASYGGPPAPPLAPAPQQHAPAAAQPAQQYAPPPAAPLAAGGAQPQQYAPQPQQPLSPFPLTSAQSADNILVPTVVAPPAAPPYAPPA